MKNRFWILSLLSVVWLSLASPVQSDVPFSDVPFDVNNIPEPVPPPKEVGDAFDLDPFYQQWIDVGGLPVLASAQVNPYAVKEAAWLIWQMIGHRADLLRTMAGNKARFSVIAHTEIITEIPEYRGDPCPDFLVSGQRGWGGSEGATISSSEESILGYPGVHGIYNTLIHEFAHGIHLLGLNTLDPTFDERLKASYETAMAKGLWQGTYASSDRREYWADGTIAWFNPNSHASFYQFGNTRQALKAYDPGLAALLTEVYGDHQWRYTPATDRIDQPHLQGVNPQSFPTFEGWTELEALYRQLNKPYSDGGGAWVNLPPYDPQRLASLTQSNVVGAATCVVFVNLSIDDVLLYGVHSDGTEGYWTRVPPDFIRGTPSRINELWVVKDSHGKKLAVFQAEEKTGRALIPTDIAAPVTSQVVSIPSAPLRAAITTALGKSPGDVITTSDMRYLTDLEASEAGITDLTGLEHAIYLRHLHLWRNSVKDLSPLAGLTQLTGLYLGINSASDLSPLVELINLESLFLDDNGISDLSPLARFTQLRRLALNNNSISDLSPLVGLTHLKWMRLVENNISDLSPLVANTGLGQGDEVDVRGNPLNYTSIHTHIPALQSRGVSVEFDTRKAQNPLKTSGDGVESAIDIPEPIPPPKEIRDFFELDPFYQQWIDVGGLPVLASAQVNPYAVKEAAWLIEKMIGHRPDLLRTMAGNKARFSVIAHTEVITEIPEYRSDPRPDFLVYRERGWGGSEGATITSSEENILNYPGPHSHGYNVLIHEFAHGIHLLGLNTFDPTFEERLNTTYKTAMQRGLWSGTYASADMREYWAEGSMAWFYPKGASSFNNSGNMREALKAYDPGLAALLTEVYGDTEWRYTPVTDRIHQRHLQGFNPQGSPTFIGFPQLEALYQQLRVPNSDGDGAWVNLPPYDPEQLPSLIKSNVIGPKTAIAFVNLSKDDVLLYWVRSDGTAGYWTRALPVNAAGNIRVTPSRVNVTWLVKDINGKNIAVFQAVEKTGRALITPTLHLITPGLSKVSGDNQRGISGTVLSNPFVIEVRDETLSALEGISVTFTVTAGGGTLSVTRTTTDESGRAESILTLGPHIGTNIVEVSAVGIEQPVTFTAVAEAAVAIPDANLRAAIENALGKAAGDPITPSELATLTRLEARDANISDLTGLEGATNLTTLDFDENNITDISPVVGLTNLTWMLLGGNNISDISALSGLTSLTGLSLYNNGISDISALSSLANLTALWLGGNNISDISPLVANTGLDKGDTVDVSGNPLYSASINVHIPALQQRGVEVQFDSLKPPTLEYLWSIPAGISLIHVPLKVTSVDGVANPIDSIGDLYGALGGVSTVNFLITYDSQAGEWLSYFGPTDTGSASDKALTDDTGIIANMTTAVSVQLSGNPLGTGGRSTITLTPGLNLVGLPLRDSRVTRVSDLFTLDGILGNVPVIILTADGDFQSVGRAGDPGDVPITGGQGFILTAQQAVQVTISGEGWTNGSGSAAAPLKGVEVTDTTPVLALRGAVVDERTGAHAEGLRVTVKNLSTGKAIAGLTEGEALGYRLTVVDTETARAARVGDVLEVSARSVNPFIGVKPLWYTVTGLDVRQNLIQLPELVAYEIPAETQLLTNYPNPFNPETWIPYRLAEDAWVTLTIYDQTGQVVRTLDVGHRIAAVYEDRSKAISWDGRNQFGETVASGMYFYRLTAGDYSATRKMLILK